MDTRLEYDKAKAVKWLMAPGLVEISSQEIADAHNERTAREISRYHFTHHLSQPPHILTAHSRRKAEERAASRALHDSGPSAVKVASMVRTYFSFLLLPRSFQ
jgi:hypothetical protein